jgi:uncharacterized protein (DUF849 family)
MTAAQVTALYRTVNTVPEDVLGWDYIWVLIDGVCNILIAVAALLGKVRVGWDDTWVLTNGV